MHRSFKRRKYKTLLCHSRNIQKGESYRDIFLIIKIKNSWSFNKLDYSSEENQEQIKDLINRIQDKRRIIEFLQFLVYLTSMDNTLIQCGSNSLHTLVQFRMKVELSNNNFENIKIQMFLSQEVILLGVILVNLNLILTTQVEQILMEHYCLIVNGTTQEFTSFAYTVCFSHDGNTLDSGSGDNSIRLWDFKI
ncbi:unnamed protein product [Paramecium pentaurelia]|uniref:Uncharacterized protein n=1 Tax=Paramecium pentaurelia TaxID=43138 RepID=A0A8S1YMF0_9CILI|nr:unnamed protein product [Paramecium pentaurelia]